MTLHRSIATLCAAAMLAALAPSVAAAFPDNPVRLVVGYPPGGATDLVARVLARELSRKWGQPVIVDNRSGASGMVAAEQVARARADGHVLLMGYTPEVMLNRLVFKQMRYDPSTDLTPIALAASAPLVLVAGPRLPVTGMGALAALRGRPLTYASPGSGGQQHIAGEMLAKVTGLDLTHVPYKGTGPAVTDLLGGQVDLFFATIPPLQQHIASGRLRPLFVAGAARERLLPEVPSAAEAGFPKLQFSNWFGVFGPKGMSSALVDSIGADVAAVLSDPAVEKGLAEQGLAAASLRGGAFRAFIDAEFIKYKAILNEVAVSAE
jgi:tripartite-type tricarboxylate transporter receptor subunit TctC